MVLHGHLHASLCMQLLFEVFVKGEGRGGGGKEGKGERMGREGEGRGKGREESMDEGWREGR